MPENEGPKGPEEESQEPESEKTTSTRRDVQQLTFLRVVENGERSFFEEAPLKRPEGRFDPADFDDILNTNELLQLRRIAARAAQFASETETDLAAVVKFLSEEMGIESTKNTDEHHATSDNEIYALYTKSQSLRLQEVRNMVADALDWTDEEGEEKDRRRLDQTALYLLDPTKFTDLARSKDYRPFRFANGILQRKTPEMLDKILPHNKLERQKLKRIKLVHLGIGDGRKDITVIGKILAETDLSIDFYGDDVSPFMNFIAHYGIVKNILINAVNLSKQPIDMWENSPYKQLIEFIKKYKLTISTDELIIFRIFNIFYEYTNEYDEMSEKKGGEPDLLKYMIARFLSLHQKTGHTNEIRELDENIELPLKLHPVNANMKNLDPKMFEPKSDEMTIFMDLGSRCNNEPFEETLEAAKRLLNEPKVRPYAAKRKPFKIKERDIDAQRYLLGHQILNFDPEQVESDSPIITEMMQHFKCEVANIFAIHLFNDKRIYTVIDNETGEELDQLKIYYPALDKNGTEPTDEDLAEKGYFAKLIVNFEEDTRDEPGVYGAVHRLRFLKPVTIRLKVSRQKITQNKTLLEIKDYEEEPGSEVLIVPSYTPELMSRFKELADNGFHVIDFYLNRQIKPTHVKILMRKMLPHEKEAYKKRGETMAMKKLLLMQEKTPSGPWKKEIVAKGNSKKIAKCASKKIAAK